MTGAASFKGAGPRMPLGAIPLDMYSLQLCTCDCNLPEGPPLALQASLCAS